MVIIFGNLSLQIEAIKFIEKGILKKPLNKTLKAIMGLDNIGSYSGRKGFTDLMLDNEQAIEDISMWLGHSSIEMTWKRYKDRSRVRFTKLKAV